MRQNETKDKKKFKLTGKDYGVIVLLLILVVAIVKLWMTTAPLYSISDEQSQKYIMENYGIEGKVNVRTYVAAAKDKIEDARTKFVEKDTNLMYEGVEDYEPSEEVEPEVYVQSYTGENMSIEIVEKLVESSTWISNKLWNELEELSDEDISELVKINTLLSVAIDTVEVLCAALKVLMIFATLLVAAVGIVGIIMNQNISLLTDSKVKDTLIASLEKELERYKEQEAKAKESKRERIRKEREEAEQENKQVHVSKDILNMVTSKEEE